MVQLRSDGPGISPYWRVGATSDDTVEQLRRHLQDANFHAKYRTPRYRLLTLVGRCQRGLLSYDKCPVAELRRFAKSRRLSPGGSKTDLIHALEEADDEATFYRFLDLPAELRVSVLEYHISSLDTVPSRASQPPVCLASRQLRLEALPIFYSTCTFHIEMRELFRTEEWAGTGPERSDKRLPRIVYDPPTFLRRVSGSDLALIKRIRLTMKSNPYIAEPRETLRSTWSIVISDTVNLERLPIRSSDPEEEEEEQEDDDEGGWVDRATNALETIVEDIETRNGIHKLRRSDLESFRTAMCRALGGP